MQENEAVTSGEFSQTNEPNAFSEVEKTLAKTEEKKELELVRSLAEKVQALGGQALIVGGYARDEALRRAGKDIESKDIDIEVYNLTIDQLQHLIEEDFQDHGKPDLVGKTFGVIKLGQVDISIPRRDSKVAPGHKGFAIATEPTLTIEEAAKRRDLTINSLAIDPLTNEIIDPFKGLADLKDGVLRATELQTFGDDPLRTLRLAQFAARFGFKVEKQTKEIARGLPLNELPKERIGEEWRKLLLKSHKPSIGIEVARELDIIRKLHPQLQAIIGVEQEPDFHPEGDVWTHSLKSVDVASEIVEREGLTGEDALTIKLAALLHDLGKPATTETLLVKGQMKLTSYGHDEAGVEPTKEFLAGMGFGSGVNDRVVSLVRSHMYLAHNPEPNVHSVRKLSTKLKPANIQELAWLIEADWRGRGGVVRDLGKVINLVRLAHETGVRIEPPQPIIGGRDLIALGWKPGKHFGRVIQEVQEAFLDGKIKTKDEAIEMAKALRKE